MLGLQTRAWAWSSNRGLGNKQLCMGRITLADLGLGWDMALGLGPGPVLGMCYDLLLRANYYGYLWALGFLSCNSGLWAWDQGSCLGCDDVSQNLSISSRFFSISK